jgi:hypothetical protein
MKEVTYRCSVTLTAKEYRKFKRWLASAQLSVNRFLRAAVLEATKDEQK